MTNAKTEPATKDTQSQIPEFWDRNVLFFANLMSLFFGNEVELEELSSMVGEVDSYGGRLIPIINTIFRGKDNVLVLEREPDQALCQYFQDALKLDLPRIEVLPHQRYRSSADQARNWALKRIEHDSYWIDGYVTDDLLATWASRLSKPTISSQEGSHRGNNKRLLHEFLEREDLPLPRTHIARHSGEILTRLDDLRKEGYKNAAIRAAVGASGIGTAKIDLADQSADSDIPDYFFHEGPCLVQGWIQKGVHDVTEVHSPSVQLFLDESTVHLFDITEQILSSDSVHEGNVSPPPYLTGPLRDELIRQAGIVGKWLFEQGYRGTASVDFIVASHATNETPVVYVSEINARITGATYPSVLARKFLPRCTWLMQNLRLDTPLGGAQLLERLDDIALLYYAGEQAGLIPVNFNFNQEGLVSKAQMLFLGHDVDHCKELVRLIEKADDLSFKTERD